MNRRYSLVIWWGGRTGGGAEEEVRRIITGGWSVYWWNSEVRQADQWCTPSHQCLWIHDMATKIIYFTVNGRPEQAEFPMDCPAQDVKGRRKTLHFCSHVYCVEGKFFKASVACLPVHMVHMFIHISISEGVFKNHYMLLWYDEFLYYKVLLANMSHVNDKSTPNEQRWPSCLM